MNSDQVTNLLTIILCIMLGVLFFLSVIYIVLKIKENKIKHKREENISLDQNKTKTKEEKATTVQYSKQSIFSFMKFDKIEEDRKSVV